MRSFTWAIIAAAVLGVTQASADEGKLKVVTEGGFPPWNLTDPSGEVKGFEIDFMKAVCGELKVECSFESQSFDAMIPALNDGKYDLIVDALGMTAARREVIDFTVPYAGLCYTFATVNASVKQKLPYEDRIEVLDEQNLEKIMSTYRDAFTGATIGTLASGTSTRFVAKNLSMLSSKPYKSPAARDLDLKAGRVDIIFASKDSVLALKKNQNIDQLQLVGPCLRGNLLGSGGVGIGVKKGNAELKMRLDPVIKKLVENGTVRKLSEQHFGIDMSPVDLD
ncbi:transporter substrate-binding domain-containing protein [Ensifer sp. ENS02]|uniref:transporter substrate-binding domain-containing protein n=1 Tax=Ensifer sp. ENS02 TaxID=2769290 RepID=UPI001787161A|nr:transporter substrate-binding domain-containing protein [Ensifer sp. ENS02]MBD9524477.1 transporter substrate-binding domain-containing protein [Ensifer sp. ENS02]